MWIKVSCKVRHLDCDCKSCQHKVHVMTRPIQRLVSYVPSRLSSIKVNSFRSIREIHTTPLCPSLVYRQTVPPVLKKQNSRGYAKIVPDPETKGISQTEYDLRRTLLMDSVPDGSVCILVGSSMKYSSDSVLYIKFISS
jgi:hypothetical protein